MASRFGALKLYISEEQWHVGFQLWSTIFGESCGKSVWSSEAQRLRRSMASRLGALKHYLYGELWQVRWYSLRDAPIKKCTNHVQDERVETTTDIKTNQRNSTTPFQHSWYLNCSSHLNDCHLLKLHVCLKTAMRNHREQNKEHLEVISSVLWLSSAARLGAYPATTVVVTCMLTSNLHSNIKYNTEVPTPSKD